MTWSRRFALSRVLANPPLQPTSGARWELGRNERERRSRLSGRTLGRRMNEYRITKYDPRHRDSSGAYLLPDEWTSYSDVGRSVSLEEYLATEERYISTAVAFLREAGVESLEARTVDTHGSAVGAPIEGASLGPAEWPRAFRSVLREKWWCRFESDAGFVHFGLDYYMYVGVRSRTPECHAVALKYGLFVEPFTSPYHPEVED